MHTDPVAADEETAHLQELKNITQHRLWLYEKQRALLGVSTPPEITISIRETETELRLLDAKMRGRRLGADVLEAVGVEGLFLEISAKIDTLASSQKTANERVDIIVERVDTIEVTTAAGAAWRETETAAREAEAKAREEGQQHRRRQERLIIAALVTILVIVAIVFGIQLWVFR